MAPAYRSVYPGLDGVHVTEEGTTFRIISVSSAGEKKPVPIVVSPERSRFLALFEEDDVDFRIQVDNRLCARRDLGYTLDFHDKAKGYLVRAAEKSEMLTYETYGPKFHFIRESREEAQSYVGLYATTHDLSYEEAAAELGRIKFSGIQYSYLKDMKKRFLIFVKSFDGRSINLKVEGSYTISEVKGIIMTNTGISDEDQRLMWGGKVLSNNKTLEDYGIESDCTLQLCLSLLGGHNYGHNNNILFFNHYPRRELTMRGGGEPGILVFGKESDQEFVSAKFNRDPRLEVEDFVVELRLKPNFGFCK